MDKFEFPWRAAHFRANIGHGKLKFRAGKIFQKIGTFSSCWIQADCRSRRSVPEAAEKVT
jgi:hypothetical protein